MVKGKILWAICLISLLAAGVGFFFFRAEHAVVDYSGRPRIENFQLLDHRGESHELFYYANAKAIVIIAHANGCPILQKSMPAIKALRDRFGGLGVKFFFLNAALQDSPQDIAQEAAKFSSDIPVLKDDSQLIAQALDLSRTTEALVVIPGAWRIAYRGAIDDELSYGGDKGHVAHAYLADALQSVVENKKIKVQDTPVQGCAISFAKKKLSFRDVAPILGARCVICHGPGGSFPNNLQSYEQIRGWASMIREVIRTQRMPPWPLDPSYGKFRGDLSISPQEAHAIVSWIEMGLPFDKTKDPPLIELRPPYPAGVDGPPDLVLRVEKPETLAASGLIPWKYFQLGDKLGKDLYIKKIRFLDLQHSRAAHHYAFMPSGQPLADVLPAYLKNKMFGIEGASPFLNGETGAPFTFPGKLTYLAKKDSYLFLNVHYEATGKEEKVQPEVQLWLQKHPDPASQIHYQYMPKMDFTLPAARLTTLTKKAVIEQDRHMVGLSGHMHFRGRSFKWVAHYPNGTSEVLLSIPRYDLRHDQFFWLDKPKLLPAKTELEVTATYDNTAQNPVNPDPSVDVHYGQHLEDEMFLSAYAYY